MSPLYGLQATYYELAFPQRRRFCPRSTDHKQQATGYVRGR